MKNKITLKIRVSPKRALRILGSLWAVGELTDKQYSHFSTKIDSEWEAKRIKNNLDFENKIRRFYQRKKD